MKIDYDILRAGAEQAKASVDAALAARIENLGKLSTELASVDHHINKLHEVLRYVHNMDALFQHLDEEGVAALSTYLQVTLKEMHRVAWNIEGALTGNAKNSLGLVDVAKAAETN